MGIFVDFSLFGYAALLTFGCFFLPRYFSLTFEHFFFSKHLFWHLILSFYQGIFVMTFDSFFLPGHLCNDF